MENDIIIFDIYGDFGHFRKFFTTASPLTYSCPPPTSIRGIVSAIVGLSKDEYIEKTNNLDVAVRILNPIKKIRMGLNYVNTKSSSMDLNFKGIIDRTQVFAEFLKEPKYRIYVKPRNDKGKEICTKLESIIRDNKNFYTVSLGLAYLLGNVRFVGVGVGYVEKTHKIDTLFDASIIKNFKISNGMKIIKERMLEFMGKNRVPGKYVDTVVEITGKPIEGEFEETNKIYKVSYNGIEENVFFFGYGYEL